MEEKDYRKEANPTYFTAKGTLLELGDANNADAIEFLKLIDMSDLIPSFREKVKSFYKMPMELLQRFRKGMGCAVELRYSVVSKLLAESGLKNFFDIACGYTPRSLFCKKCGVDYIGIDVPIVVDEMNEKVGSLVKQGNHMPYIPADATNPVTIIKAAENLNGELFLSCEGLLMYLSIDELHELFSGIKGVLAKHGGAWYTSDFGVDYKKVPMPFIGDKMTADMVFGKGSTQGGTNDINFFANTFKSEDEKIKFFEKNGFIVEKIPIKGMDFTLKLLDNESEEVKKNVQILFDTFSCWKMTLKNEEKDKIKYSNSTDKKIYIQHSLSDGKLFLKVIGRIDTINSPELLKVYDIEANSGSIDSIVIDANELEYLSSAGLRVILKMAKALKSGSIVISGANDVVKNIFKTTGFADFVKII